VYEIVDTHCQLPHLPGYVYLELRYLLTECSNDGKYAGVEYDGPLHLFNYQDDNDKNDIHGPAVRVVHRTVSSLLSALSGDQSRSPVGIPYDTVRCVRCLVWPSQAANWPTRRRNYNWPDSATVDRVISNGCDVVPVAHRQCRQHELMGKLQWRLSFSRAEIVLLNSWMPIQQIVYHLLRDFMKTELLTGSVDNSEAGTLSNYHIKTLMLRECERKPRSWWTDDQNLVRICVELLHVLADWLTEKVCPHYFINNCCLIDSSFNLDMVRIRLISISKSWLSSWFVYNYIRRCTERFYFQNISYDDAGTTTELHSVISAMMDHKVNTTHRNMLNAFTVAVFHITGIVSIKSLSVRSLNCWLSELRKISPSLLVYLSSVAFLHVAYRTERSGLNDELMNVLFVLVGQSVGPRRYASRRSSVLSLNKAISLMKAVDDRPKSRSTVQLIAIELSKAYLYRTLSWEDSDSDSVYCLANVYLAVLYYTTGQYQTAIDHCTLVMRSQDHSQCSSHVVQGEILPTFDDDVDIVLGLAVFYQHIRIAALNPQQQSQYVTVFTTELFAHYLHIKYVSTRNCQQLNDSTNSQSSTHEVQSYETYISEIQQLFIGDLLLLKFFLILGYHEHNIVSKQPSCIPQYRTKLPSELNTSDLVELLQRSAVEHMTAFRQLEVRDFGSVATIVTTDFEALYAYKRGDYQQCLKLSAQNVRTLVDANETVSVVYVASPVFIQLLDDEIVSLTALTVMVNPQCRMDHFFCLCISQLTLSLYLMTQCQSKLRQSLQSLAQTLDYIKVAHRRHPVERTLDRLVLKMIAHNAVTYITTMMNKVTTHNSC